MTKRNSNQSPVRYTAGQTPPPPYGTQQDRRAMALVGLIAVAVLIASAVMAFWINPSFKAGLVLLLACVIPCLIGLRIIRGSEEVALMHAEHRLERPVSPGRRARRVMTPDEELWKEDTEHPIVLIGWVVLSFLLVLLFVLWAPTSLTLVVFCLTGLFMGLRLAVWHFTRRCFSDWRVFVTEGLIGRSYKEMAYFKMTDVSIEIPWHSDILSRLRIIDRPYGTLVLESAGQNQALSRLKNTKDIETLFKHMSMRTHKSNS